MKKRLLSWLMVLTLCLTLLPTAALAAGPEDGADEVQDEQQLPEQPVEETKQEQQPVEESKQEEQEESGDAVQAAQALIDALPDKVTADNADELQAQLMALDEALDALTDEQRAELDMTRYEAVCEVLSNLTAVLAGGTHEHYLCGGTECNEKGHELEEGGMTTFEPWTKDAVTTGGAYYLTGDIGGFTVPDGVDLTLCLNGHNISSSYDGPTIKVEPGATFTLCDCNGSGNGQNSRIRHSGGTNETYGIGVLVGEKTSVSNGAVFNMYGGTISNNNAYEDYEQDGGGVTVDGGTFNLYGGTISNNKALSGNKVGGGVFVGNQGTFNMSGGTITENTAYKGGGVCVGGSYQSSDTTWFCGTFNMSGGSITGNTSGGVYVNSNSGTTFKVSGTAEITGNTASDNSTQNVYLSADTKSGQTRYATPIVVEETLTGNIGVTTEEVGQTVATDVSAADAKRFTSDSSKYRLKYDSSESTLTMISAAHSAHPICGAACTHGSEHTTIENWQGVSSLPMSKGNYYLTKDVEINGTWQAPNGVNLCLNGYGIIETGDVDAIKVNGNTFTLCDCVGTGEITHAEGKTGSGVYVINGTFIMHGGSITGNRNTKDDYGHGGGVSMEGGSFTMTGGSITKNSVQGNYESYGGGVCVGYESRFTMTGGSITENTTGSYGGGVYVDSNSTAFTVSGEVNITGNTHGNIANNVELYPLTGGNLPTITIGEGGLDASAKIGVTAKNVGTGEYVTVATGASNGYTEGNIFSDKAEPYATRQEGNEVRLYNGLPHVHYRCNGKNAETGEDKCTEVGGHTEDGVLSFEPWTNTTKLPTTSGHYYLKQDVTLESTWSIQGTSDNMVAIVLCLNGHSIQLKDTSSSDDVIRINEHATLSLCDCNGSGKNNGTITGGTNASGVNITSKGAFVMYGGSISGNGIGVNNGMRFHMYGGSITGNGCGVNVNSTDFIVAGDVTISGNKNMAGKDENVYLPDTMTITVGGALSKNAKIGVTTASTIAEGNYITVANGDQSYGSKYTLKDDDLKAFASDSTYNKLLNGNNVVFTNGNLHTHAVCGKKTCTDSHDTKSYMPLTYDAETMTLYCGGKAVESYDYRILAGTDENDNKKYIYYMEYRLPAGNYYLADNIALNGGTANGKTYVGGIIRTNGYGLNVNLCLNGKILSATNPNTPLLSVPGTQTLTLSDCKGGGKLQTAADGYHVLQVFGDKGKGGTFTMYGGTISGACIGVYAFNYSVVNLFGGTITDNECGLDIGSNSSVTVGGTVNITGNTEKNLYLYTGSKTGAIISIDATLTQASRIGITTGTAPTAETPIQIATGATENLDYYTEIFTPDVTGQGYTIILPEGETNLYLSAHQHSWNYTLSEDGKTITATCTDTTCTSPNGGKVTIVAPDENTLTYDGNTKEARLENTLTTGVDTPTITYTYQQGESKLAPDGGKPVDAHTYTAEITVGGQTASVTYTIEKAAPKAEHFDFTAPSSLIYDGNDKLASVNAKFEIRGMGSVTVKYYQGETVVSNPMDAGEYIVKIEVGDGLNYKAATGLTAADFFPKGTELPAGAKIASVTPASGTMMASVTVNDGTLTYTSNTNITATENESYTVTISTTNYNNFTVTLTFRPADKQPQTNFGFKDVVDGKVAKVYGTDKEFTLAATGAATGSTVTYESTDTNVATVDGTGEVTIVGAGTAKITAKASATENYAEATAEYTLTVEPKELKATDLQFVESSNYFTKTYDGTAATGAVVVIKDSAKVNASDDLPTVTGTCVYDNKNVTGATKVTFTSAASDNTNYILPEGLTVEHAANITKRVLTVGKVTTIPKTYNTLDNALDCVTGIELIGTVSGETLRFYTSAETGGDYGIHDTKFDSANAGARTITGTVALLSTPAAANYTFKDAGGNETTTATFTADGEIVKANARDLGTVQLKQRYTDTDEKEYQPDYAALMPANAGKLTYDVSYEVTKGTASVGKNDKEEATGKLTYQISAQAGAEITWTFTVRSDNYKDSTFKLIVTITDRDKQENFKFKNTTITKTYGDPDFTVAATGAEEGSAVTYTSSDPAVATVDADGTVTIKKAGTVTITATAEQTDVYASASASYTLTVNKATVTVKAKDKSAYVGDVAPELPTAPVKDTDYTVTGLIGEDTLSGTVTLAYGNTPDMNKVGEETIRISGTLANANYEITYVNGKLSITNRPSSGGGSYTPTYPVSTPSKTENGSVSSNVKNASKGDTVTITVKPDSGYVLDDLTVTDKNGNELKLNDKGNGKYTFTMPAGKVEVKASFAEAVETSPFADVETNAYYYEAVKWAADKGITGGIGNSLFGPNQPCTRAQIVTFLWRAAGSPEPKGTAAGMTDVVSGSYYEKAVAWAIENGVTTGTTASTFSPNATCTRAQAVTFLARALSAKATSAAEFSDVPANSYFAEAVAWAAANSVTEGVGNGLFAPHNNCTRAQIVTFLYRAYNK